MKTYRIVGVYSETNYEQWLVVGCSEDQVLDYVIQCFNEFRDDGQRRFKSISFSEE